LRVQVATLQRGSAEDGAVDAQDEERGEAGARRWLAAPVAAVVGVEGRANGSLGGATGAAAGAVRFRLVSG
jgi:hypothetical protein